MTYTEKELDQFLHGISLSLLSKKSAQPVTHGNQYTFYKAEREAKQCHAI